MEVIEPRDSNTHIRILEDRFLYAARRREKMMERNPYLTDQQLWAVDQDLAIKKNDLDQAIDFQRRRILKIEN